MNFCWKLVFFFQNLKPYILDFVLIPNPSNEKFGTCSKTKRNWSYLFDGENNKRNSKLIWDPAFQIKRGRLINLIINILIDVQNNACKFTKNSVKEKSRHSSAQRWAHNGPILWHRGCETRETKDSGELRQAPSSFELLVIA